MSKNVYLDQFMNSVKLKRLHNRIKRIVHKPIADFLVSRKHGLKRNPLLSSRKWSHSLDSVKVKVVLFFQNKTLLKMACFEKFYKSKTHLETAQKLPNDHLAGEVSKNVTIFRAQPDGARGARYPLFVQ